jgi:hypothetical protein
MGEARYLLIVIDVYDVVQWVDNSMPVISQGNNVDPKKQRLLRSHRYTTDLSKYVTWVLMTDKSIYSRTS